MDTILELPIPVVVGWMPETAQGEPYPPRPK